MPIRRYQALAQPEGAPAVAETGAPEGWQVVLPVRLRNPVPTRRDEDLAIPRPVSAASGGYARSTLRVPKPGRPGEVALDFAPPPPTAAPAPEGWEGFGPGHRFGGFRRPTEATGELRYYAEPRAASPGYSRSEIKRPRHRRGPDDQVLFPIAAAAAQPTPSGWEEIEHRASRLVRRITRPEVETLPPQFVGYGWGDGDVAWVARTRYVPEEPQLLFPVPDPPAQTLRLGWEVVERFAPVKPPPFPQRRELTLGHPVAAPGQSAGAPGYSRSTVKRHRPRPTWLTDVPLHFPVEVVEQVLRLGWDVVGAVTGRVRRRGGVDHDVTFPVPAPQRPSGWEIEPARLPRSVRRQREDAEPFAPEPRPAPNGWATVDAVMRRARPHRAKNDDVLRPVPIIYTATAFGWEEYPRAVLRRQSAGWSWDQEMFEVVVLDVANVGVIIKGGVPDRILTGGTPSRIIGGGTPGRVLDGRGAR